MGKVCFFAFFLAVCIVSASLAEGADLFGLRPPAPYGVFSTMSANTPGKGRAAVAFSAEKSGRPDFLRLSSHLAYGVIDNVEVSVSVPYVEDSNDGLEDIAFGIKHRILNEGRHGPSAAYILTASVDSGTEGLGTEGSFGAGIALSKRVGPFNGHVNAFYGMPRSEALEDEISMSGGVEFAAAHSLRILGELYGRKSHFSEDIDQLEARFGYRFIDAEEALFTTVSVGFGLDGRLPRYRLMASLSFLFPGGAKEIRRVYEQ